MDLCSYLRIQVHANALANHRLGEAIATLPPADWSAPRVGFFPSLAQTLNHILAVDLYYIAALRGDADPQASWHGFQPCGDVASWRRRQRESDLRLVAWCDALDERSANAWVELPRRDHVQRDRAGHVLAHLVNHQTHHRGQAHAMLCATAAAPPQLDEFMMPSEAHLREPDMHAFGWDEAVVYQAGR